jgi:hypothetical protein
MTSMSSICRSSNVLTGSEISSDDSQDQISIEQYDSDDQESFTKDRFRGTGAVLKTVQVAIGGSIAFGRIHGTRTLHHHPHFSTTIISRFPFHQFEQ